MLFISKLLCSSIFAVTLSVSAHAASFGDFPGVWQMEGYGKLLDITSKQIIIYDYTTSSCQQSERIKISKAGKSYTGAHFDNDKLSIYEVGGLTRYDLEQVTELPEPCKRPDDSLADDPFYNFDILVQMFTEHYAFFDLRGVNWAEVAAEHRARITPQTTDDQLFRIMSDLLGELNDGHVMLESDNDWFDSGGPGEMELLWAKSQGADSFYDVESGYYKAVKQIEKSGIIRSKSWSGAKGMIKWGWAEPGIGYLSINTMGLPGDPPMHKQFKQVDKTMGKIVKEFADADALIVDTRFNDGGYDSIALHIMGYLTTETRLAFTKKARVGNGFTQPQEVYYSPQGVSQLTCPIVYLQSGSTISAAEIFTLAMMDRPDTLTVGQDTYGVMSDMLEKYLPNGWWVSISNEVYTAANDTVYEGTGIPADLPMPIEPEHDFQFIIDTTNTVAPHFARQLVK